MMEKNGVRVVSMVFVAGQVINRVDEKAENEKLFENVVNCSVLLREKKNP